MCCPAISVKASRPCTTRLQVLGPIAMVLTECDLAQLDAMSRRLLLVGLKWARVHLGGVISGSTALPLQRALQT
jgi:hypothetical protein